MMVRVLRGLLVLLSLWAGGALPAQAQAWRDAFDTVWESLWYQGGSAEPVTRWGGDIRVRLQGRNVGHHRERILQALRTVARDTGLRVLDVADPAAGPGEPTLEVELVDDLALQDNMACFVRRVEVEASVIRKSLLRMREGAVYHCVLHEAMHVMGISGHPRTGTVLSYFHQRVDRLTELDALMVKAWYSPAMKAGMTPFEALAVLTDAVVAGVPASDAAAANADRRRFHDEVVRQMEAFATGEGEVPLVIKRSGTASAESMARGRTLMRLYLGLAYARGTLVEVDARTSLRWMERAARDRLAFAQWLMGNFAERGIGQQANDADAYVWYALASAQGLAPAAEALARVAARLAPEAIEAARRRVASFN